MVLNERSKVVALAGGVGGAKLVYGLAKILPPERFSIIGNVADDLTLYGLHISPDLDTVMYTLAEVANPLTGWGLVNDSRNMIDMLTRYGEQPWFGLGDRDLATHLIRSKCLAEGMSLTAVTARLSTALGVQHRLLPVTDDPLATMVDTVEYGTLAFQEYFVRYRWQPTVKRVWFSGETSAQLSPVVADALREADMIVICPSNPVLSIEPLLAVPGMRALIQKRRGFCVAVSPFIGGKAVKGPAEKLMYELGLDISPQGLLRYYSGLVDGLVMDNADANSMPTDGTPILVTSTLMQSAEDKIRLANEVLDWVGSVI